MGGKKKHSSKEANPLEPFWTFPRCLFPSPSIHPLSSLPVLYSTSGAIFPPLLCLFFCPFFPAFLCPLVSLRLVVSVQPDPTPHRQQPGCYPALYSPVHCDSATMSTRSVVDG